MLLTGNQSFFELSLLDVQPGRSGTREAPVVEVAVRSGWQRHRSVAMGAVLRPDEVSDLIDWLRQTGMGQSNTVQPRLLFDDTSLAFDCVTADADECLLQIKLDLDLTPTWHLNPLLPFWVPIVTTRGAVEQAADDLQHQFDRLSDV